MGGWGMGFRGLHGVWGFGTSAKYDPPTPCMEFLINHPGVWGKDKGLDSSGNCKNLRRGNGQMLLPRL